MQPSAPLLSSLLDCIVTTPRLHARWLNTLSFMENIGARKINASLPLTSVCVNMLKHAAEEARHAYYLKKQLEHFPEYSCPNYETNFLLGGSASKGYMMRLDWQVSRLLKQHFHYTSTQLKSRAYVWVTALVERRALTLYQLYQSILKTHLSPVQVKSILAEEIGHLTEMEFNLAAEKHNHDFVQEVEAAEERLYQNFIACLAQQIFPS